MKIKRNLLWVFTGVWLLSVTLSVYMLLQKVKPKAQFKSVSQNILRMDQQAAEMNMLAKGSELDVRLPARVSNLVQRGEVVEPIKAKQKVAVLSKLPDLENRRTALNANNTSVLTSNSNEQVAELAPSLVVYPQELIFEFPRAVATEQNIKRAMVRLLLSKTPFQETNWLDKSPMSLKQKPFFYKRVLDHNGQPMRYPIAVYNYVNHLLKTGAVEGFTTQSEYVLLHIPIEDKNDLVQVDKYSHIVGNYAKQFNISPNLVFAIMEVESNFNPEAVSPSNALGLMQLKANAAGQDVYKLIDQRDGRPGKKELFDSENNIRMGTAYLGLLKHDYLSGVRNAKSREFLTIASYNGGLTAVLEAFSDSKEKAINKINRLHPNQVYRTLRYGLKSQETRLYIEKVLKAKDRYQELLDSYV
ncbi:murein transglycosylase domain-containing protein [Thiomicrorhabdus lithotrophica]|uniref:Murein transglycosylase domain-containing protein n=1 Tax=Thiomicrorhabdus lithotrophica TaxID=2949997 RepID=A0ABY8CCZ5_9GAMM|nr:murein transglycosylase domain-containing protein [Thiomicrorhabdus lithotrophica]WEJ63357.1 murein transglycosylase domain-containing protein [Thiomicrorhabdus lithotrophica]